MSFCTTTEQIFGDISTFKTATADKYICFGSNNMTCQILTAEGIIFRKVPDKFDTGQIHLPSLDRISPFQIFQSMCIIQQKSGADRLSPAVSDRGAFSGFGSHKYGFLSISRPDEVIAAPQCQCIIALNADDMIRACKLFQRRHTLDQEPVSLLNDFSWNIHRGDRRREWNGQ